MLILTGSEVDGKIEVLCQYCQHVVMLADSQELGAMTLGMTEPVICFECDLGGDIVHPSLYDQDGQFLLKIDGSWISVNIWREVRAKAFLLTQKNQKIAQLYDHLLEVFAR